MKKNIMTAEMKKEVMTAMRYYYLNTDETEADTSDYDEMTDMLNSELDYLENKYQHKLSMTEYLFCMKKAKYLERVE
jgi:hypothetical protein